MNQITSSIDDTRYQLMKFDQLMIISSIDDWWSILNSLTFLFRNGHQLMIINWWSKMANQPPGDLHFCRFFCFSVCWWLVPCFHILREFLSFFHSQNIVKYRVGHEMKVILKKSRCSKQKWDKTTRATKVCLNPALWQLLGQTVHRTSWY